jgi:LysM repeat protein
MTAVEQEALPETAADAPGSERPLTRLCPYLAALDGGWRSASVARDHRCGAVAPPAILAAEKQRRLCLTTEYPTCATFEAARAARPIAHDRVPALPRPLARTTPVVLDHGRLAISMPAFRSDRSVGQAVLIIVLAIAFAAIVLARVAGVGGAGGATDASPSPSTPVSASATPSDTSPTSRPTGTTRPSGSAAATPAGGASSAPSTAAPSTSATRTYKVQPGDTLIGIAARFGTTPKAIVALNGITDPSSLKIGQTLKIP